jgi:predicted Holliday junction resolvase-like endonuclease
MKSTEQLIKDLQTSNLIAECPCGEEFKLADAVIFDGTKKFPKEALEYQQALLAVLDERALDLKKREKLATERAENTTKAVNIGKNLEKIFPTLKDFKWEIPDTRFLGDPIDLIIFKGLSEGKVDRIDFVEIKTGKAPLNKHQKSIKSAIEDNDVSYKVFK